LRIMGGILSAVYLSLVFLTRRIDNVSSLRPAAQNWQIAIHANRKGLITGTPLNKRNLLPQRLAQASKFEALRFLRSRQFILVQTD